MAGIAQLEVKIDALRAEFEQLKANAEQANELPDTTTPAHIIVHDGNDYKKVSGIPVIMEETADMFIFKHPNGTVIIEHSKD